MNTDEIKQITKDESTWDFFKYEEAVLKHAFYPGRGHNLTYTVLGLTGEAGEVANTVKKLSRDDAGLMTNERREKIIDELGDVLWYIAATASEVGLKLQDVAAYNVRKLRNRYGADGNGKVTGQGKPINRVEPEQTKALTSAILDATKGIDSAVFVDQGTEWHIQITDPPPQHMACATPEACSYPTCPCVMSDKFFVPADAVATKVIEPLEFDPFNTINS